MFLAAIVAPPGPSERAGPGRQAPQRSRRAHDDLHRFVIVPRSRQPRGRALRDRRRPLPRDLVRRVAPPDGVPVRLRYERLPVVGATVVRHRDRQSAGDRRAFRRVNPERHVARARLRDPDHHAVAP